LVPRNAISIPIRYVGWIVVPSVAGERKSSSALFRCSKELLFGARERPELLSRQLQQHGLWRRVITGWDRSVVCTLLRHS
jgi:hypothetical protein